MFLGPRLQFERFYQVQNVNITDGYIDGFLAIADRNLKSYKNEAGVEMFAHETDYVHAYANAD